MARRLLLDCVGKVSKVVNSGGSVLICWSCVTRRSKNMLGQQRIITRAFSSAAKTQDIPDKVQDNNNIFTTNNPTQQSEIDCGKYYTVPYNDWNSKYSHGFPQEYNDMVKTFKECQLMVRRPAIQIIKHLQNLNENEVPKFILYGDNGCGKTLSLCHVIHFCHLQNWIVVQFPKAPRLGNSTGDVQKSSWNKERYDQPEDANNWLRFFNGFNDKKLREISTSQRYTWRANDVTEKDEPITKVVEKGLSRSGYSCDAVGIILKELRCQSSFKILYAVDEFNGFFQDPMPKGDKKLMLKHDQLSLVRHFTKIVEPNFSIVSGCYVMGLSQRSIRNLSMNDKTGRIETLMKQSDLDKIGDFTSIEVPAYTETELKNTLQFYRSKNWLHKEVSQRFEEDVTFLTGRNPRLVNRMCLDL